MEIHASLNSRFINDSTSGLVFQRTAGFISFISESGIKWVNNIGANFVAVDASGNLGLNTIPSIYRFHAKESNNTIVCAENTGTTNLFGIVTNAGSTGNCHFGLYVAGVAKGLWGWDQNNNYMGFTNFVYNNTSFGLRLNSDGSLSYHDSANGTQVFGLTKDGSAQVIQKDPTLTAFAANGKVGAGTLTPTSTLHSSGSFAANQVTTSGTYTVKSVDNTVFFDTRFIRGTGLLPTAVGCGGRQYKFVDKGSNANGQNVLILPNGTEKINNVGSGLINTANGSLRILSDNAGWYTY